MPVTEHNSTVKIAFINEKILQFYCRDCQNHVAK